MTRTAPVKSTPKPASDIQTVRNEREELAKREQAIQAREEALRAYEGALRKKEEELSQRECAQDERDRQFEAQYNERIAELDQAVLQFNGHSKALAAREAQLTARPRRSVRGIWPAQIANAAAKEEAVPAQPELSWYEKYKHNLHDARPRTYVYNPQTGKEEPQAITKIDYLKRVIAEMPESTSFDEQHEILRIMVNNQRSQDDWFFHLKISLTYILVSHILFHINVLDENKSSWLPSFLAPKIKTVSNQEEIRRADVLKSAVQSATDFISVRRALETAKDIDKKILAFSTDFQSCLERCDALMQPIVNSALRIG